MSTSGLPRMFHMYQGALSKILKKNAQDLDKSRVCLVYIGPGQVMLVC